MIGFFIGWLRYYHKIELLTSALNVYMDNNEKMANIKEYIKAQGINIKGIKFGKSKAKYFMDKHENTIYQGIESIKFCNAIISAELYELSKNKSEDFISLLIDIANRTSVDARQLHILTVLNFFSDYGKNKRLLKIIDLFDSLYHRKQINKSDIEDLGINIILFNGCYDRETEKMYMGLHMDKYIRNLAAQIKDEALSIKKQIENEQEYLGNIMYKNPNAPKDMYYVVECKFYKDKTKPYLQLYNLRDGVLLKTKITSGKAFVEAPFKEGNVINVKIFDNRNKSKKINGEWRKTDEKEKVVKKWDVY